MSYIGKMYNEIIPNNVIRQNNTHVRVRLVNDHTSITYASFIEYFSITECMLSSHIVLLIISWTRHHHIIGYLNHNRVLSLYHGNIHTFPFTTRIDWAFIFFIWFTTENITRKKICTSSNFINHLYTGTISRCYVQLYNGVWWQKELGLPDNFEHMANNLWWKRIKKLQIVHLSIHFLFHNRSEFSFQIKTLSAQDMTKMTDECNLIS